MFTSPHTSGCAGGVSGTWGSASLSSCEWSPPGQATVGPTAKARPSPSPKVSVIARMQVDQAGLQPDESFVGDGEEGTPGGVVCLYIYQVGQRVDGWRNVHYCNCSMEESLPLQFRDFFTTEGLVIHPRSTKWLLRRPRRQSFNKVHCVWSYPSDTRRMRIPTFVPSISTLTSLDGQRLRVLGIH